MREERALCGTAPAYRQHLRRGEPTCEPCKAANNESRRFYMTGRKKREDYVVQYKPRGLEWMFTPAEWAQQARCAGEDPDWWFSDSPTLQARALEICAECPVRVECASEAIQSNAEGIWGGLTEQELDQLKKNRRRSA